VGSCFEERLPLTGRIKEGILLPVAEELFCGSVGCSVSEGSVASSVGLFVLCSVELGLLSGFSVGFFVRFAVTDAAIITISATESAKKVRTYDRLTFLFFSFCQKLGLLLKDEGIVLNSFVLFTDSIFNIKRSFYSAFKNEKL
jgi:hypothetical protein